MLLSGLSGPINGLPQSFFSSFPYKVSYIRFRVILIYPNSFLGLKPKIAASKELVAASKDFIMINTEVCGYSLILQSIVSGMKLLGWSQDVPW